jgi:hypothetical protein
MKIEYVDENNFIIYLNKYYIKDLDIENKKSIEEYFKKIFVSLKNNYNLDIYGYYDIRVYTNKQYGLIIDVYRLSNDYYKLYNNKIDMKIVVDTNNTFIYEVEDYFIVNILKRQIKNVYYKNDKYYIELNDKINDRDYNYLLENSKIIYDDNVYDILSLCSIIE